VYFTVMRSMQAALASLLLTAGSPVLAETAYIAQVNSKAAAAPAMAISQPVPLVAPGQPAARSMAFVPTPEMAAPARGNLAQTLQIGNSNAVIQAQIGGNNTSNVGIFGGRNNEVGVFQGGGDRSNVNLINTQGLAVAVLQPAGAPPINALIARLPNGALLIKR
jgi:hypothetical protein